MPAPENAGAGETWQERVARLARRALNAPLAVILGQANGAQPGRLDAAPDSSAAEQVALACAELHRGGGPLAIADVEADPRLAGRLAATGDPVIRAYAGVPLHASDGTGTGMLCVLDHRPRVFDVDDIALLLDLAALAGELAQQRMADPSHARTAIGGNGERESELRRAIGLEHFVLHYQPKVDLTDGRITGLEALIRWMHPERGMIPPVEFIPLAEETGLIVPLGAWTLREACRQMAQWQAQGLPAMPVAVNVSSGQFLDRAIVATVEHALRASGAGAGCLEIELTESASMSNPAVSALHMQQLREMGVSISIDDFGTGYSSLSYLKRLPVDKLKIDRSFVQDIAVDEDSLTIVQAVIAMAHRLGLKVVAEGVETEKQLAFLSINRCDEMQGYYFSRPLTAAHCEELLRSGRRLTVHRATKTIIDTLFGG